VGEGDSERPSSRWNAEPLSPARSLQRSPHDDDVIAEGHSLILGREIRKRRKELRLIRSTHRLLAFAADAKWDGLKEAISRKCLEDRVDVACRLRFTVRLEQTKHLLLIHR